MSLNSKKFEVSRKSLREIKDSNQNKDIETIITEDFSKRISSKGHSKNQNSVSRSEHASSDSPDKGSLSSALKQSVRSAEDSTPYKIKFYSKRPVDKISSIPEEPERNEFTQKLLISEVNNIDKSINNIEEELEEERDESPSSTVKRLTFGDSKNKIETQDKPNQNTEFIVVGSPCHGSKRIPISKERPKSIKLEQDSLFEKNKEETKSLTKVDCCTNPFVSAQKNAVFSQSMFPRTDKNKENPFSKADPLLFSFHKKDSILNDEHPKMTVKITNSDNFNLFNPNITVESGNLVPRPIKSTEMLDNFSSFNNIRSNNELIQEEKEDLNESFFQAEEFFEADKYDDKTKKLLVFFTNRLILMTENKIEMNDVKLSFEEAGGMIQMRVQCKNTKNLLYSRIFLKEQTSYEEASNGVKMSYCFIENDKAVTELAFIEAKVEENRKRLLSGLARLFDEYN